MTKQIERLIAQAALAMKTDGITNPTEEQCKAYFLGRIERESFILAKMSEAQLFSWVSPYDPRPAMRAALAESVYSEIRKGA